MFKEIQILDTIYVVMFEPFHSPIFEFLDVEFGSLQYQKFLGRTLGFEASVMLSTFQTTPFTGNGMNDKNIATIWISTRYEKILK